MDSLVPGGLLVGLEGGQDLVVVGSWWVPLFRGLNSGAVGMLTKNIALPDYRHLYGVRLWVKNHFALDFMEFAGGSV